MRVLRRRFLFCFILPILIVPSLVLGCGYFLNFRVFVPRSPVSLEELAAGKVGVVRPTYSTRELFLAYRGLNGEPLTAVEKASILPKKQEPGDDQYDYPSEPWLPWGGQEKRLPNYNYFINCNDDAFRTATAHFNQLSAREGMASPSVQRWRQAQMVVFKNCSENVGPPEDPTPDMTAAQRADRMYQIAAANFYATNYDVAAEQFRAIANDKTSEWRDLGLFLAARCYLRKGTLGALVGIPTKQQLAGEVPPMDKESLQKGLDLLQQVAADKSLTRVHDSALRLIGFAELCLHPDQQAIKLAASLRHSSQDENFATHLDDYLHLIRDGAVAGDEMGDWITSVKQSDKSALVDWKDKPKSQSWLVAALLVANGKSEEAPKLISAATDVSPASPAFSAAQFQATRLRYERGELAGVRKQIDDLFSTRKKALDASAIAGLTLIRSRVATSLEDFAKFAIIRPVGVGAGDWSIDWSACPMSNPDAQEDCDIFFTPAAAARINHLPLSALIQLTGMKSAPLVLRKPVAQVAFERGVLLGDFRSATAAAEALSGMDPKDAETLKGYLAARSDEERRYRATLVIIQWPGVMPWLDTGYIRDAGYRDMSQIRLNWWRSAQPIISEGYDIYEHIPADDAPPSFLSQAERTAALRELKALGDIGTASIWLPKSVIAWAKAHKDDPTVPEALYLAVRATRFGMDNTGATPYSKQAFELLHRNYPKSTWAEKTKYYY